MRRTPMQTSFFRSVLLAAALCFPAVAGLAASAGHRLLGLPAPDFALRSAAGPNIRLSEYRGDVVVLAFWGSRCGVCAAQLAALDQLTATYQSAGLVTLGVDVDDNQDAARAFLASRPVKFPMLLDPGKTVSRAYQVDNLPMTVLIDRGGNVRYVHRDYGAKSDARYLDELRELLNE